METRHLDTPDDLINALGRGFSHQAVDENGWTDLHHAALFNLAEPARALLAQGANVNATLKTDGRQLGADLVKTLNGLGVHFRSWEREGDTPLHMSACSNAAATAEVLLRSGADVYAGLGGGGTPLNVSARFKAGEATAVLLAHGADTTARDAHGWTPLHNAACAGALKTVELLLKAGADVNALADQNVTPLHLAVMQGAPLACGDPAVPRLLLDWGADVNAVSDPVGSTPLDMAEALGRTGMAQLLRRFGGDVTIEEKVRVAGMINVKTGRGGALVPIMKRTVKRRPPRPHR